MYDIFVYCVQTIVRFKYPLPPTPSKKRSTVRNLATNQAVRISIQWLILVMVWYLFVLNVAAFSKNWQLCHQNKQTNKKNVYSMWVVSKTYSGIYFSFFLSSRSKIFHILLSAKYLNCSFSSVSMYVIQYLELLINIKKFLF